MGATPRAVDRIGLPPLVVGHREYFTVGLAMTVVRFTDRNGPGVITTKSGLQTRPRSICRLCPGLADEINRRAIRIAVREHEAVLNPAKMHRTPDDPPGGLIFFGLRLATPTPSRPHDPGQSCCLPGRITSRLIGVVVLQWQQRDRSAVWAFPCVATGLSGMRHQVLLPFRRRLRTLE